MLHNFDYIPGSSSELSEGGAPCSHEDTLPLLTVAARGRPTCGFMVQVACTGTSEALEKERERESLVKFLIEKRDVAREQNCIFARIFTDHAMRRAGYQW